MKLSKIFIFISLPVLIFACKSKKEVTPASSTTSGTSSGTTPVDTTTSITIAYPNKTINTWAFAVMDEAYFWSANMPTSASLDNTTKPADFYEKLIYNRTTVDRFSEITNDYKSLVNDFNGVYKVFGLRYAFAPLDSSKVNYGMFLSYITTGSAAENAGLKRGDVIIKIDNTNLNTTNLSTIMGNGDTHTFTLGQLVNGIWQNKSTITITRQVTNESPIGWSKVINLPSGKKLGYFLYNQFQPGLLGSTAADSVKYDTQMKSIFANFKSSGVTELVLDLRFNGGGYISSASLLASLIGSNVNSTKVFYADQWNSNYTSYFKGKYGSDYFNHRFSTEANNIGSQLSRVFVMISNNTASASELVINGLRPYMPVITVGEHTYGKNLFGTLIEDTDDVKSNYGMYIMLGQTANANGQSDYGTVNGMTPDNLVTDNKIPYLAFGDYNETLFAKVLNILGENTSTTARSMAKTQIEKQRFFIKENVSLPESRMIIRNLPKIKK